MQCRHMSQSTTAQCALVYVILKKRTLALLASNDKLIPITIDHDRVHSFKYLKSNLLL